MASRFIVVVVLLGGIFQPLMGQSYDELIAQGDERYSNRKYQEAISFFTQAIALDPHKATGYWFRGDAEREIKLYTESVSDYSLAIGIEKSNAKFWRLRGDSYYNMGNIKEAEQDYSEAIRLDPKNSMSWLYRGDCYVILKQNDQACEDFKKAQELGSREAKQRGLKTNCAWANKMAGSKVCPSGEVPVSRIETDALNGAVFVSHGIEFDGYQILTKKGEVIGGPEFRPKEAIHIGLLNVKNFCSEKPGEIYLGVGYTLRENGGREFVKVDNLYDNNKKFTGSEARNISLNLELPADLTPEKQYILTAHFFDTRGNVQLFMEMPFKISDETLLAKPEELKRIRFNGGIHTVAVSGEISGMELHHKGRGAYVAFTELRPDTEYVISAIDVRNINKRSHVIFRFLTEKGDILVEHKGNAVFHGDHVKLDFSTAGIKPGNYKLWLKLQDATTPVNIGIVVPVVVN